MESSRPAELRIGGVLMNCDGVMSQGLDAAFGQCIAKPLSVRQPNDVKVVDVPSMRRLGRERQVDVGELGIIVCGDRATAFVPAVQSGQLDSEHSSLQSIKPAVGAVKNGSIAAFFTVASKQPDPVCDGFAAR